MLKFALFVITLFALCTGLLGLRIHRDQCVQSEAIKACNAFCTAEDIFRRKDYNKDGVLEYTKSLRGTDQLYENSQGAGDLALIDRSFARAESAPFITGEHIRNASKNDNGAPNSLRNEKVMQETGEICTTLMIARSSTLPTTEPKPVLPGKVHWAQDAATAFESALQTRKPVLLFAMLGRLDNEFC